jgi:DNA-binding MarR family transcriptional regulator
MEAVGYTLKRVQHGLRAALDAALRDLEVTSPQYAVLAFLERSPGLSGAQLARRAFVTPQTMHRIVAHLEAAGLVAREPHPEVGRRLDATLTPAGWERLAECHRRVQAVETRLTAELTAAERRQLLTLLERCQL